MEPRGTHDHATGQQPERLALIVGINDYPGAPLSHCITDATEMAAVLEMPEYAFKVSILLNEQATRRAILQELTVLRARHPDLLLFYFSGHGCVTDVGAFLVTADGVTGDEGVSLETLGRLLSHDDPDHGAAIALLDCCHSGGASARTLGADILRPKAISAAMPPLSSSALVAACRPDEYAFEDSAVGHGLFTHHLLLGLLGEAADTAGEITISGLYDYACRPFRAMTPTQTPVFKGDLAGGLMLASGFEPRRTQVPGEEVLRALEAEAARFLENYHSRTKVSYDRWKEKGWRESSKALEPILEWFETKLKDVPELRSRNKFTQAHEAALARLQHLANVEPGIVMQEGIITKQIGGGAFGTVWLTEAEGRRLAYKIYHPGELRIAEKVRRFEHGYKAMKQMDHPNIVKVFNYTTTPLGFFMDFIEGPNMRQLNMPTDEAEPLIAYLLAVAQTIVHAHAREVIHRDIKPENIIALYDAETNRWIPHLTDFDLAWFSTATQVTKEALGTTFYAAPEQVAHFNSAAARSPAVDVYSFGQLLYFAATGSDPIPMAAQENRSTLATRLEGWTVGTAARRFLSLYERTSVSNPAQRMQSMQDVADELADILQDFRSVEAGARISPDQFAEELAFITSGFTRGGETAGDEFHSLSGQTSIEIRFKYHPHPKKTSMEARLIPQHTLGVEGAETFEIARQTLNKRIDAALSGVPNVTRRSGKKGVYEVFLEFNGLPLSVEGVRDCSQALRRAITAMERP